MSVSVSILQSVTATDSAGRPATYYEILVESSASTRGATSKVQRRYREFRALHHMLEAHFGLGLDVGESQVKKCLPTLPPKTWGLPWQTLGGRAPQERGLALDDYLKQVLRLPRALGCAGLLSFLGLQSSGSSHADSDAASVAFRGGDEAGRRGQDIGHIGSRAGAVKAAHGMSATEHRAQLTAARKRSAALEAAISSAVLALRSDRSATNIDPSSADQTVLVAAVLAQLQAALGSPAQAAALGSSRRNSRLADPGSGWSAPQVGGKVFEGWMDGLVHADVLHAQLPVPSPVPIDDGVVLEVAGDDVRWEALAGSSAGNEEWLHSALQTWVGGTACAAHADVYIRTLLPREEDKDRQRTVEKYAAALIAEATGAQCVLYGNRACGTCLRVKTDGNSPPLFLSMLLGAGQSRTWFHRMADIFFAQGSSNNQADDLLSNRILPSRNARYDSIRAVDYQARASTASVSDSSPGRFGEAHVIMDRWESKTSPSTSATGPTSVSGKATALKPVRSLFRDNSGMPLCTTVAVEFHGGPLKHRYMRAIINGLDVHVSANQLHGLCMIALVETADSLTGQDHLFKRSLLLVQAWAERVVAVDPAADQAGSSTPELMDRALSRLSWDAWVTVLLWLFARRKPCISSPWDALVWLVNDLADFEWGHNILTMYGSLPCSAGARASNSRSSTSGSVIDRGERLDSTGDAGRSRKSTSRDSASASFVDKVSEPSPVVPGSLWPYDEILATQPRSSGLGVHAVLSDHTIGCVVPVQMLHVLRQKMISNGWVTVPPHHRIDLSAQARSSAASFASSAAAQSPSVSFSGASPSLARHWSDVSDPVPMSLARNRDVHSHKDPDPTIDDATHRDGGATVRVATSTSSQILPSPDRSLSGLIYDPLDPYLDLGGDISVEVLQAELRDARKMLMFALRYALDTDALLKPETDMPSGAGAGSWDRAHAAVYATLGIKGGSNAPSPAQDEPSKGDGAWSCLDGSTASMMSAIEHCCFVLGSDVSPHALLSLATDILADILAKRGPLPVGELGKLLQDATANPGLSAAFKEKYGGLKRFLESHPVFLVSTDHPFNPFVYLLQSLTKEQAEMVRAGKSSAMVLAGAAGVASAPVAGTGIVVPTPAESFASIKPVLSKGCTCPGRSKKGNACSLCRPAASAPPLVQQLPTGAGKGHSKPPHHTKQSSSEPLPVVSSVKQSPQAMPVHATLHWNGHPQDAPFHPHATLAARAGGYSGGHSSSSHGSSSWQGAPPTANPVLVATGPGVPATTGLHFWPGVGAGQEIIRDGPERDHHGSYPGHSTTMAGAIAASSPSFHAAFDGGGVLGLSSIMRAQTGFVPAGDPRAPWPPVEQEPAKYW